jgi:hypothetical protein
MKRIALYKECLRDLPFRERVRSNPTLERIYNRPGATTRRFMDMRQVVFTRNLERYLADALDPIFVKYTDLPPMKDKYEVVYRSWYIENANSVNKERLIY